MDSMEGRDEQMYGLGWSSLMDPVADPVNHETETTELHTQRIHLGELHTTTVADSIYCSACHRTIRDRTIYEAFGKPWHRRCLRCFFCGKQLEDKSHVTSSGRLCCIKDHRRLAQISCASCDVIITRGVQVHHVMGNIYHKYCFRCQQCDALFNVGDNVFLRFDHKLECSLCFNQRFKLNLK